MFDTWPDSQNYRHSIQLRNQDNEGFFKKQNLILVEIKKFLRKGYKFDETPLALWLRTIDMINNEWTNQAARNAHNP